MSPTIPVARNDDPEDVSWALSTAATSFARGDRVEALKWLRRAAEAASEAERDARALELAKAAAELSTLPPAPVHPPSTPPPASSPPAGPARPLSAAPRPATAPLSRPPPAASPGAASKTASATSKAPSAQAAKDAAPPKPKADEPGTQTQETAVTQVRPLAATPTAVVGTLSAADADAWPTPTDDPDDGSLLYGQERTRIGTAAYKAEEPKAAPTVATQAVRVVLWRGPDGTLRVAAQGTAVSAVVVEALLVALEPDADLLAWLAPP